MSSVGKRPAVFYSAATVVIDNSSNAYRAAIDLHDQEQVSAGVLQVETGQAWDYNQLTPLITPEGLKTRLQILEALKAYAQALSNVTKGVDSPALNAAAKSAGSDLEGLGSTIHSDMGGAEAGLTVNTETANAASTALLALGEYLVSRRVNAALPSITAQMDPQVETLCKLLNSDIETIRKQSKKDYEDLSRQQWTFIQINKEKLTPLELRDEIEKLPSYRQTEQRTDVMLADLDIAIARLATTHHALAAAAQANNREALSERIADLEAAGTGLGNYYQSLTAKGSSTKSQSKGTDPDADLVHTAPTH